MTSTATTTRLPRTLAVDLPHAEPGRPVRIEGWVHRRRQLAAMAFLVIRERMGAQAELVWAFLAPRTFATDRVIVSASLEPAYEVGGDAFDYSLNDDRLHVSIFDSVGHDLAAALLASVGMASCRASRRAGGSLPDIVAQADGAIARQYGGGRFVTAVLCDLDISTGQLSWIPCGHPPPPLLLIRGGHVVKQLNRRPQLPLGLADLAERARRHHGADGIPGAGPPCSIPSSWRRGTGCCCTPTA